MSDMAVFIYLCFFVALFGATFAFMFKSMTSIYQMDKPIKRRVHPEMDEVETGTELLCLLYTSPSPRDLSTSRMPSSA